ncbi:TfoX/Sxy family protein [Glycomyces sp. L485]|uniref:TfoX/Sxy family protein n=1 Tax=Glycomyces sp. L485 TaxID=2909235 RepID=UPI001F4A2D53|nr:TfoX/Sxy family protein [Glycomyces sp. L485]MCH7231646.1 TfoX/Sxy family protein [Glycomyces sp. L485]
MAYDERLAGRVREILGDRPDLSEQKMFGGLAWLVGGNMAVAARGDGGLMVRVDRADHTEFLTDEGAAPTIMRGSAMRGWITVAAETCEDDERLRTWVRRGLAFAETLPPK